MTAKEFKAKYAWGSRLFCGQRLDTRMCSNCKLARIFLSPIHTYLTLKSVDCVYTKTLLKCMACSSKFSTSDYCGCAHWEGWK